MELAFASLITEKREEEGDVPVDDARAVPARVTVRRVLPGPIRKPARQEQGSVTRFPEQAPRIRGPPSASARHGGGHRRTRVPRVAPGPVHASTAAATAPEDADIKSGM